MSNSPLSVTLESQIDELLTKLTLKEKCALLSGLDNWRTVPIPRLGIRSLVMTDGPHGVRSTLEGGRTFSPATSFPTGISMAASWNTDLIYRVGQALAEETRALGCDVLLGPCVNIIRHPLAGRNFESYSEDPYLAGKIGVAYVKGVQSRGVGASLKHFALNNQETERLRGSSDVDKRTMREIYLAQFEAVVKNADPWTVMCAYNRINEIYASQNPILLREILKEEWGYQGAVISDWGAVHATVEPLKAGLDLEMPGPARWFGQLLVEAVATWQLDPAVIDDAVRRILGLLQKTNKLPGAEEPSGGTFNTPEHQSLAGEMAEESLTLLKNEGGILPLNPAAFQTLAVIGPMAATGAIGGGGSSFVIPPYRTSPLEGLNELLGGKVELEFEQGCDNFEALPALAAELLTPDMGEGGGLYGQYFASGDFSGQALISRVDQSLDFWTVTFAPLEQTPRPFSVRWSGKINPPMSGLHTFGLENAGSCRLYLNDQLLVENTNNHFSPMDPSPTRFASMDLIAGQAYDLRIEFVAPEWLDYPHLRVLFGYTPLKDQDPRMDRAVKLARRADVVLIFAGWPEYHETEGRDRTHMNLTGRQDELITRVAAANPNCIVVLNTGSPVAMPWIERIAAVLHAYYPGMEGGRAVARTLLGDANPSGKLPVTFPLRLEDTPAFNHFPELHNVHYGEGIFVGYRHYDHRDIAPLYPFGHGLSYTQFEYSDLTFPESIAASQPVQVRVTVRNSGNRFGKEVVQLYMHDQQASVARPPAELKGFAKIGLQPGASQTVIFELDGRAFAFFDPQKHTWTVEPGIYEIRIGSSSRDIRLVGKISVL